MTRIYKDPLFQNSIYNAPNSVGVLEVEYTGRDWDAAIDAALEQLDDLPHVIIAIPKGGKLCD